MTRHHSTNMYSGDTVHKSVPSSGPMNQMRISTGCNPAQPASYHSSSAQTGYAAAQYNYVQFNQNQYQVHPARINATTNISNYPANTSMQYITCNNEACFSPASTPTEGGAHAQPHSTLGPQPGLMSVDFATQGPRNDSYSNEKVMCPHPQCGKSFTTKGYLIQHRNKAHGPERKYKCKKCGKSFELEADHDEHKRKHDGEKPHKCNDCQKQFNHKTDLNRHLFSHTGKKPFKCQSCGKSFTRRDHMIKHMATHSKGLRKGPKNPSPDNHMQQQQPESVPLPPMSQHHNYIISHHTSPVPDTFGHHPFQTIQHPQVQMYQPPAAAPTVYC